MAQPWLRRLAVPGLALLLGSCVQPSPVGRVVDEAMQAGRPGQSFKAADEDYFRAMDGGVALTPEQVRGRNTWIAWTGGNDRFWDGINSLLWTKY